jgi:hypothetical protein
MKQEENSTRRYEGTHHVLTWWLEGANGERSATVTENLHVSRSCDNCDHYRPNIVDDEWDAGEFGPCMNLAWPAGPALYCTDHQTTAEFAANVHRIDRPALTLVKVSGGVQSEARSKARSPARIMREAANTIWRGWGFAPSWWPISEAAGALENRGPRFEHSGESPQAPQPPALKIALSQRQTGQP